MRAWWLTAALAATALPAQAQLVRVAVLVSNPIGDPDEAPLLYSDDDAARVAAVMRELGGLAPEDVILVPRADLDGVAAGLRRAVIRTSALKAAGSQVLFLVYYTGHAGTDGLHLGGARMSFEALKAAARVVPADQRVFIVDACQSGRLFRSKGARLVADVRTEPATFVPPDDEAWITSSGPEEQSFEVDRRRGSIFTHFLVSGSRGPADADADRKVSLAELFAFVRSQTSAEAARHGRLQEPRWAGRLGDVVVAELDRAQAAVSIAGPVPEPIVVARRDTEAVVAEVPVGAGGFLALPPGPYQLLSGQGASLRAADLDLREGSVAEVNPAQHLERHRDVRTKGGLLVRQPWLLSVGYRGTAGATPGGLDGHGVALSVARELGRGHRLGVVLSTGVAPIDEAHLEGRTSRATVGVVWTHALAWRGVRLAPGVAVEFGALRQKSARTPDPVWGAWYGDARMAQTVSVPVALVGGLAEVSIPWRGFEVLLSVSVGGQTRLQPAAPTTAVVAWDVGFARRF